MRRTELYIGLANLHQSSAVVTELVVRLFLFECFDLSKEVICLLIIEYFYVNVV